MINISTILDALSFLGPERPAFPTIFAYSSMYVCLYVGICVFVFVFVCVFVCVCMCVGMFVCVSMAAVCVPDVCLLCMLRCPTRPTRGKTSPYLPFLHIPACM